MSLEQLDGMTTPAGAPAAAEGQFAPLEVDDDQLRQGIAATLFVAEEPVATETLAATLGVEIVRVEAALAAVGRILDGGSVGIELREVGGGWRLMTAPAARPVLERWIIGARHGRLTQAALETLAVVAYRQPITRATIGEIRGVNPDGALRSLVTRGLVAEVAREDGPGQAALFGTTVQFLERLGLRRLDELPPLPPYLPDGPAPDEPEAGSLVELRKRLRDGSERLGGPARGAVQGALLGTTGSLVDSDDDDDAMAPPPVRPRATTDEPIVELTERLEKAARSAMGRLRDVRDAQSRADRSAEVASTTQVDEDGSDRTSGTDDDTEAGPNG
jgi:segregation and condensation protein B